MNAKDATLLINCKTADLAIVNIHVKYVLFNIEYYLLCSLGFFKSIYFFYNIIRCKMHNLNEC